MKNRAPDEILSPGASLCRPKAFKIPELLRKIREEAIGKNGDS